jgi:hydroxymethylpyrimidine pyrophosphatase-like HAD family hydrolase
MIRAAGIGVAMANGTEEVKTYADYVTLRDNNHDGIAEIVDKFLS